MLRFIVFIFVFYNSFVYSMQRNMVFIPDGSYIPLFKYSDNQINDPIYVKSFYMDKYPVTNSEFKEFLLKNPTWNVENISNIFADNGYLNHWVIDDFNKIKNQPVVNVSWFAANAFCSVFGGRLPSIDEWEYVASSSETDPVGKNDVNYLQNILNWYIDSQHKDLYDIDLMKPNYWGIFGMHGIIWELVYDFNSVILLNTDAEGGGLEEVLYCGATATNAINPADYVAFMRFAFRNSLEGDYTMSHLGFRCVKNVKK